ncbi:MAG: glycosyltransferase [Clostridium sp.]
MEENKLVSILVFSYNNLKYLEACFQSIFIQNYSNIEIVLCDDSSDNFNEEEIRNYIEKNKGENIVNYIIHRNEENQGFVKNINNGIRLSNGEIIVHTSIDDVFFEGSVISAIVNFYKDPEFDIACGYIVCFDEELKEQKYYTPNPVHKGIINGPAYDCYKFLCQIGSFFPSPGLSYRRSLIDKYGYYDERYRLLDDYPRFLSLTRRGCRIGFIDKLLIKYRDGGISTNVKSKVKEILENDMALARQVEIEKYNVMSKYKDLIKAKNIDNLRFSKNIVINQKTVFNGDGIVEIGENVILGYDLSPHFEGCNIMLQARYAGSKISIGKNTIFSNDVNIISVEEISIGEKCLIGDRVTMIDCDFHEINPDRRFNSIGRHKAVIIGNNVWVGSGVTILQGVTIGDNAVIGANSVVTKSIPMNAVVGGNPAKVIGNALDY